jgi:PhnB protein
MASMADTMDTYRTLTPYLVVPDADAEIRFLTTAFGATEKSVDRNSDGTVMHAEIVIGDSLIMIGQGSDTWKSMGGALYLWVADVDGAYAKAVAAGATSQSPPEDKPYGHRNAGVVDANGITWWIGSPVRA